MFPVDAVIWERFIEQFGSQYVGFDYDVKVGTGLDPENITDEKLANINAGLYKFRIDAIGFRTDEIEIIEVKPRARANALGQVQAYINLYRKDLKPTLRTTGVIVTDIEVPDMRELTREFGIKYFIV